MSIFGVFAILWLDNLVNIVKIPFRHFVYIVIVYLFYGLYNAIALEFGYGNLISDLDLQKGEALFHFCLTLIIIYFHFKLLNFVYSFVKIPLMKKRSVFKLPGNLINETEISTNSERSNVIITENGNLERV